MKLAVMTKFVFIAMLFGSVGCATKAADMFNPFGEEPEIELGERSNKAILEGGDQASLAEAARRALEVSGNYRGALAPEPVYPTIQPAEVRLMWVPDHLTRNGDLVPAHYYYLKVMPDRWAVQDAFELEEQLNQGSTGAGSATPWIYDTGKR
jgi:hypothetical protein